jgi:hypothetical protein
MGRSRVRQEGVEDRLRLLDVFEAGRLHECERAAQDRPIPGQHALDVVVDR